MNTIVSFLIILFGTAIPQNEAKEFVNPPLPYELNALDPVISEKTLSTHYGKHQQGYINNLNKLKKGTPYDTLQIEEIVMTSDGNLFNNAAQALNHAFYFESLTAPRSQKPSPALIKAIESQFGSLDSLKQEMTKQGASQFGSGWVWLVKNKAGKLEVIKTPNADTPLKKGLTPILVFDVWEHAYYLDYLNKRTDYLDGMWAIVDWDMVEKRFRSAD
ncbi:MAG: superoxide dismutase [Bacteroidales bacterium]